MAMGMSKTDRLRTWFTTVSESMLDVHSYIPYDSYIHFVHRNLDVPPVRLLPCFDH